MTGSSTTAATGEQVAISAEERYRIARRVTVIGALVDGALGVAKVAGGIAAQSQALIADGIHSFSDLITDGVVLVATRHASREADADHPYGHGRIETLATVVLGASLGLVAVGIAWDAVWRMLHPEQLMHPGVLALVVAGVSVAAKEAIYHYTVRAGRRLRSPLLEANAWHSRSDAISSVVVMVGVAGSMMGFPALDAIAAIGVALMIAKIAWDLGAASVRELIDTGLGEERIAEIRRAILDTPGVSELHMLRTRSMGAHSLVDVHILVSPTLSVSEGHQIGETVRGLLCKRFEDITDVTVHIDPEDDEKVSPSIGLPDRDEITEVLSARWRDIPGLPGIDRMMLHYLQGRVHVDVVLPLASADLSDTPVLAGRLADAARDLEYLGEIEIYYH